MTAPSSAASVPPRDGTESSPAADLLDHVVHPHPHTRRATYQAAPRRFPTAIAIGAVLVVLAAVLVLLTVMLLDVAR